MDSFETFSEDKLPDKSKFYSSLKNESIRKKDYLHATNVWNMFNMNAMGDYYDLYLNLLWADVFEKFIFTCLKCYILDSWHCFSSPGLSWDAMLKMTKTELQFYLLEK